MPLHRRITVRLLAALLLVFLALAGGLWWNATRLNETERKLVGVWELDSESSPEAMVLLADRRAFHVYYITGKWTTLAKQSERCKASPTTLTHLPSLRTVRHWTVYLATLWFDSTLYTSELVRLTDEDITLEYRSFRASEKVTYRRSTDPELLRLFNRLSAGESP